MTHNNAQDQCEAPDSRISRPGFGRQNVIELTRQAIAQAQPLALSSDKVIILAKSPRNAMVFADPEKFLHGMGLLFANAVAMSPPESVIAIKIMFRGLQVMIALESHGEGLDTHTIEQISDDFDQLTWPDTPDPTDVTFPSNSSGIDRTVLHIRKCASSGKPSIQNQATTRAVLAFTRITFRQMT